MKIVLIMISAICCMACSKKREVQKYKFVSSQILLTGTVNREGKQALLDSCKNSIINYFDDSIEVNALCIFNEVVSAKTNSVVIVDSQNLANSYSFLTTRYEINNDRTYKKVNLHFMFSDGVRDSASILFLDNKKLLLIYEPFVLQFEQQ